MVQPLSLGQTEEPYKENSKNHYSKGEGEEGEEEEIGGKRQERKV